MGNKIKTYDEFCEYVNQTGFLLFSKNKFGYISLEDITNGRFWHTGTEFDPWTWKDRIALEKKAAYTRMLNKKLIFISLEWYPYFLTVYKKSESVQERYNSGELNNMALRVYDALKTNGPMGTNQIKEFLNVSSKEDRNKFAKSIEELQDSMDITVCGASKKINKYGKEYGWLISEFSTVKYWMEKDLAINMPGVSKEEAVVKLKENVKKMVPAASEKEICRFLKLTHCAIYNAI